MADNVTPLGKILPWLFSSLRRNLNLQKAKDPAWSRPAGLLCTIFSHTPAMSFHPSHVPSSQCFLLCPNLSLFLRVFEMDPLPVAFLLQKHSYPVAFLPSDLCVTVCLSEGDLLKHPTQKCNFPFPSVSPLVVFFSLSPYYHLTCIDVANFLFFLSIK